MVENRIETVMNNDNDDLVFLFYSKCVSRAVGKRKWNEFAKTKPLSEFVTPSDEAYAMLVLENNVSKWMGELRFGKSELYHSMFPTKYTQGKGGRKWSNIGLKRFIELLKYCREYRVTDNKKEIYRNIELIVMQRMQDGQDNNENNDLREENNNDETINKEDEMEIERELLATANGET